MSEWAERMSEHARGGGSSAEGNASARNRRWPGRSSPIVRVAEVLLAPMLAAGAVGAHWWINVPDQIVESASDQGIRKNSRKRRKTPSSRALRNGRGPQVRSETALTRDWQRWSTKEFDQEPVRSDWARSHQGLISRAVVMARHQAFEGSPESPSAMLDSSVCHTVRCRFTLSSPYRYELDAFIDSLKRVQADGRSVWRSFESVSGPSTSDDEPRRYTTQVTVGFVSDDIEMGDLHIAPDSKESSAASSGPDEESD